ncbi:MAG: threonylcarbamoyl-AMP synthase [Actinomycetaceae bacterium]|nr:threonylcarbamoyl-AMP synthase [Actinomycetaceae bacterium]
MAAYIEIHPENPQERLLDKVIDRLRDGATVALPTDSGYALTCMMNNKRGLDTIRMIRRVSQKHHFTLLCHDFAQLGQLVIVDNSEFRLIRSLTPGPYTFILKATKDVPRMMLHPKKQTVGVRIPDHTIVQALLDRLGEPILSSTLILPDEEEPLEDGWIVREHLDKQVDVIVEGPSMRGPTSVINFVKGHISRHGVGNVDGIFGD